MSEKDITAPTEPPAENLGQSLTNEDKGIPESPNKWAGSGEAIQPALRLHPSTIADLALAIAGLLEPMFESLITAIVSHPEEAMPIAQATLFESVALGRNQAQHISPDSPSFSRYKVKMEFGKGVLWVRWETWDNVEGVAERVRNDHILIVPPGNIRHLTPVIDGEFAEVAAEPGPGKQLVG